MLQKVAFTMYPVKDMPRARAFCEDTLALGRGSGGPSSPWVEFDLPGGGCLAITTVSGEPAERECRRHDCFRSGRPAGDDRRPEGEGRDLRRRSYR